VLQLVHPGVEAGGGEEGDVGVLGEVDSGVFELGVWLEGSEDNGFVGRRGSVHAVALPLVLEG